MSLSPQRVAFASIIIAVGTGSALVAGPAASVTGSHSTAVATSSGDKHGIGTPPTTQAPDTNPRRIQNFQDLVSACQASTDPSTGFGDATVDKHLTLNNVTGTIPVNCTVHLVHGAQLTVRDSAITTKSLVIADDIPSDTRATKGRGEGTDPDLGDAQAGSGAHFEHSTFTGQPGSGLMLQLRHANDNIVVRHSAFDYDKSVWMVTTNTDPTGKAGNIEASASTMRSNGATSEGIHLVAGGRAQFVDDTFHTTATDDLNLAILYGRTGCDQTKLSGAVPKCTG